MENKKTIILSILGVLVLVIAVVGVSFAMYTFSATGTRQNTITSGTVSLVSDLEGKTLFSLTEEYAKSDASGVAQTPATFTLLSALSGTMTVKYDVGFVDLTTDNRSLTAGKIKLQISSKTGDAEPVYYMGTANSGALLSTIADSNGQDGLLTGYVFDSGTITGVTGVDKVYSIKAWIDESYVLKGGEAETANTTACSVNPETNNTAELCAAAGGAWEQSKPTTPETFRFKIKIDAAQI